MVCASLLEQVQWNVGQAADSFFTRGSVSVAPEDKVARLLAERWGFANPMADVVCGRCGASVPEPSSVTEHIQNFVKLFRKQTTTALVGHFAELLLGLAMTTRIRSEKITGQQPTNEALFLSSAGVWHAICSPLPQQDRVPSALARGVAAISLWRVLRRLGREGGASETSAASTQLPRFGCPLGTFFVALWGAFAQPSAPVVTLLETFADELTRHYRGVHTLERTAEIFLHQLAHSCKIQRRTLGAFRPVFAATDEHRDPLERLCSSRVGHSAARRSSADRVLVFGGLAHGKALADLFEVRVVSVPRGGRSEGMGTGAMGTSCADSQATKASKDAGLPSQPPQRATVHVTALTSAPAHMARFAHASCCTTLSSAEVLVVQGGLQALDHTDAGAVVGVSAVPSLLVYGCDIPTSETYSRWRAATQRGDTSVGIRFGHTLTAMGPNQASVHANSMLAQLI